jgi:hypothetical protein
VRLRALLTLVAFVAAAAGPKPAVAAKAAPALAAVAVLANYESVLAKALTPPYVSFEYTVEQVGVRDLQQDHRIYRDRSNERDELLSVNGEALTRPVVRLFRGRVERYTLGRLAPRASGYTFHYLRTNRDGKRTSYEFATTPKVPGQFRIDRVTIDGTSFMPTQLAFTTKSGSVVGRGALVFGKVDRYYVPFSVNLTADVQGKPTREKIVWSHYRFPDSLPSNVFTPPRPLPSPDPAAPT